MSYYEKHKKEILEKVKQQRINEPEKFRNYCRKYYKKNREKILEYKKIKYLRKILEDKYE